MSNEWFVERTTYTRKIKHPVTKAEAEVVMRPLNAGDRAEFNEIRLLSSADGETNEGALRPGRMQLLAVERAVVSWTIPGPGPTAETIAQLDPRIFDQLYEHVSFGNPELEKELEVASGDVIEGTGRVVPLDAQQPRAAEAS